MADKKNPLQARYSGIGQGFSEGFSLKPALRARYSGPKKGYPLKPAIRAKYGGTPPPPPKPSGMDIIRSSASSPSARPRIPKGGPRQPKATIFGQEFPRTSPTGSMTAMQRSSPFSLGKTLSSIGSAVSSGVAAIDRDLRATAMKPRSPVRTPSPRRTPVVATQPKPAGTQAVQSRPGPNVPRMADQWRRGRGPAQFGTVRESPMNKPGMLNIPRAGKKLASISAGAELPVPPGMKPTKPKAPKATPPKAPKATTTKTAPPKPAAAAKPEKVNLPKPPKKVTPPKPPSPEKVTINVAEPPKPSTPAKRGGARRAKIEELGKRGPVSIFHEGGRNVRVVHSGGASFYLPYNPKKKGPIKQEGVDKALLELGEPTRSDIAEKERKGPAKFVYNEERDKAKRDKLFGSIKDERKRTAAFERNEQQRRQSAYNQRQERLKTKYKGDVTLRRMANIGGQQQIRLAKGMGLMGLGVAGMAPDIIRLARGASLGSLAGPMPSLAYKGNKSRTYDIQNASTGDKREVIEYTDRRGRRRSMISGPGRVW